MLAGLSFGLVGCGGEPALRLAPTAEPLRIQGGAAGRTEMLCLRGADGVACRGAAVPTQPQK